MLDSNERGIVRIDSRYSGTACAPRVPSTEPAGSKSAARAPSSRSSTARAYRCGNRRSTSRSTIHSNAVATSTLPCRTGGAVEDVHGRVASSVAPGAPAAHAPDSPAEAVGGLGEHGPQRGRDDVELVVTGDERRRQLHHGVAAVVGARDQTGLVAPGQQEPTE